MAKIAIVFGTRPEIIRLSRIIPVLKKYHEVFIINTKQNFEYSLSDLFLKDFNLTTVEFELTISKSSTEIKIKDILRESKIIFKQINPDCVLILGDTYSGLSAVSAFQLEIPVFHMEAGNRCFDIEVPEEKNRIIIDNHSKYLIPYTQGSRKNLLLEGFADSDIFVSGNPILEVIRYFKNEVEKSDIISSLGLDDKNYLLCTLHRAEGIDHPERLSTMLYALDEFARSFKISTVVSTHPRLRARLRTIKDKPAHLNFIEPLSFFDFIKLEQSAALVATDSGTVQEEACIFGIPAITLREVTERPETVECGSNILVGYSREKILSGLTMKLEQSKNSWIAPSEYLVEDVSQRVNNFILEKMQ
jgi:UDP-N-acetylglucosamine 2-epimerase (non-hydrolysing)